MYIGALCVCDFIAEKLNVRHEPSVFVNASETAIGMVGVYTSTIDLLSTLGPRPWVFPPCDGLNDHDFGACGRKP